MKDSLSELELISLYGLLTESGISQNQMTELSGESQPTISGRIKEYRESPAKDFHRKLGILTLFKLATVQEGAAMPLAKLAEKVSDLERNIKEKNASSKLLDELHDLDCRVTAIQRGIQECFPEEIPVFVRELEKARKG